MRLLWRGSAWEAGEGATTWRAPIGRRADACPCGAGAHGCAGANRRMQGCRHVAGPYGTSHVTRNVMRRVAGLLRAFWHCSSPKILFGLILSIFLFFARTKRLKERKGEFRGEFLGCGEHAEDPVVREQDVPRSRMYACACVGRRNDVEVGTVCYFAVFLTQF